MKVMSLRFVIASAVIVSTGMYAMEHHAALTTQQREHIKALKPYFNQAVVYRDSAQIATVFNELFNVVTVYLQDAYNGTDIQAIAYQELELMRTQVGSILSAIIDDASRTHRPELLECLQPLFVGMQEEVQLAHAIAQVKVACQEAAELRQALDESIRTSTRSLAPVATTTTTTTTSSAVQRENPALHQETPNTLHAVNPKTTADDLRRFLNQKTDMQAIVNGVTLLSVFPDNADLVNQAIDVVIAHAKKHNDHAILGRLKSGLGFMHSRYEQVNVAQQAIVAKVPAQSSDTRVTDAQGFAIAPEVKKSGTWLGFFAKTSAATATCAAIGAGVWWYLNR